MIFTTQESQDVLNKKFESFTRRHPIVVWIITSLCLWLGIQKTKEQIDHILIIRVVNIQEKYESYSFLTDEHTDYYLFVDQTSQESFYGETKLPLHIRQKIDTSLFIDQDSIFAVIRYPLFEKDNFKVVRVDIADVTVYPTYEKKTAPPE